MIETQNKKPFYKKWWTIALAVLLFLVILTQIAQDKDTAKESFMLAEQHISQGNIDEAKKYLKDSTSLYTSQKNNPAFALEKDLEKAGSQNFIHESLLSLTEEEFEQLKSNNLHKIFFDNESLNSYFVKILQEQSDSREKLLAEREEEMKIAEQKHKEEQKKQQEEERTKKIEKQFDVWDGSHIEVTKHLKKNLNDPKSYEHIETRYTDKGDHLVIFTDFRTKNTFNATIKVQAISLVDLDGNIQKVTINTQL